MIFDTHLHAVSSDAERYPLDPRAAGRGAPQPNEAAAILDEMRTAGVDKAALVQFVTVYGYDNSFVADAVACAPESFIGVCSVDPFAADAAEELQRLVTQGGMRGLRLFTPAGWMRSPEWPDERSVRPIMLRAEGLRLPVAVQVRPAQIPALRRLALSCPDVRILVDHLAGIAMTPDTTADDEKSLLTLASLPNVYLKFSTQNLRHPAGRDATTRLFRDLIAQFGAGRLMWGSNFPVARGTLRPYGELVDEARSLVSEIASEAEQALILGGNAAKVYRFE